MEIKQAWHCFALPTFSPECHTIFNIKSLAMTFHSLTLFYLYNRTRSLLADIHKMYSIVVIYTTCPLKNGYPSLYFNSSILSSDSEHKRSVCALYLLPSQHKVCQLHLSTLLLPSVCLVFRSYDEDDDDDGDENEQIHNDLVLVWQNNSVPTQLWWNLEKKKNKKKLLTLTSIV